MRCGSLYGRSTGVEFVDKRTTLTWTVYDKFNISRGSIVDLTIATLYILFNYYIDLLSVLLIHLTPYCFLFVN